MEIAEMVREVVGNSTQIEVEKANDLRSYHISSDRLTNELGFRPKRDVPAAVDDLAVAFERGEIHTQWMIPNTIFGPCRT